MSPPYHIYSHCMILPREYEVTETPKKLDSDRCQLLPAQNISHSKIQIVQQTNLRLLMTYEIVLPLMFLF